MRIESAATEKCRSHSAALKDAESRSTLLSTRMEARTISPWPCPLILAESSLRPMRNAGFALWQMRMPSESAAAGIYRFHSVEFEICRHEPGTAKEGEFFPRQRKGTELVQRQPKMRSGKAAKAAKVA